MAWACEVEPDKQGRILIFHKNKANMITKFTACFVFFMYLKL